MPDPYKGTALMFCDIIGEPELSFAWFPVKCYDGSRVWMRSVWRRLAVVKPHLKYGPDDPWWQYARVMKDNNNA